MDFATCALPCIDYTHGYRFDDGSKCTWKHYHRLIIVWELYRAHDRHQVIRGIVNTFVEEHRTLAQYVDMAWKAMADSSDVIRRGEPVEGKLVIRQCEYMIKYRLSRNP